MFDLLLTLSHCPTEAVTWSHKPTFFSRKELPDRSKCRVAGFDTRISDSGPTGISHQGADPFYLRQCGTIIRIVDKGHEWQIGSYWLGQFVGGAFPMICLWDL